MGPRSQAAVFSREGEADEAIQHLPGDIRWMAEFSVEHADSLPLSSID